MGARAVLLGRRHRRGQREGRPLRRPPWVVRGPAGDRSSLRPGSREGQVAGDCCDAVGASSAWVLAFGAVLPRDFWDAEVTFFLHVEKYSFISIGATVNK